MVPAVESSDRAKARIASYDDKIGVSTQPPHVLEKHPFAYLKIGQSFAVPVGEIKESSIRVQASLKSKALGKRFTVLIHNDAQVYEVARIA